MRLCFETEWGQLSCWPVLWVGYAECECCEETVYAIGLSFGAWNLSVQFGG